MKITFTDSEIDCTEEYKFWRHITNKVVMDSPVCRSDLIDKYLYDSYKMVIEDFTYNHCGPLKLRSVECPDSVETFFRLKYKEFT